MCLEKVCQLMDFTVQSLNRDLIVWVGIPQVAIPSRILALNSSVSPEETPAGREKSTLPVSGAIQRRRLEVLSYHPVLCFQSSAAPHLCLGPGLETRSLCLQVLSFRVLGFELFS